MRRFSGNGTIFSTFAAIESLCYNSSLTNFLNAFVTCSTITLGVKALPLL